jgi:hypothetical protein
MVSAAGLLLLAILLQLNHPEPQLPAPVLARPAVAEPLPNGASRDVAHSTAAKAEAIHSAASNSLPRLDLQWQEPVPELEFARFAEWTRRYLAANPADRKSMEADGVRLAQERRDALRTLIQSDPGRALALAVPLGVRRALPDSITALLEDRLTGRGSLDVFGVLAEPGKENQVTPTFRKATLDGREYDAFVYGRRLGEPTRQDIPLNGIAVDRSFAINENSVRLLEPEEVADLGPTPTEPVCSISGNLWTSAKTPVAAEVGGEPTFLCAPAHALQLNEKLLQAEIAGDIGGGGGDVQGSAYTEGTKDLILIRVDFSDLAGVPFPDATGASLISGLNDFYRESSYGRTGFSPSGAGSDVTPTLRMPQTAAYYGANNAYLQLRSDARAAAAAAGYTLGNYDFDLICFGAVPGWGWAGLGYVGAPGVWLRSYFTAGVAGHELGHNYGLNHANFWDTGGQSTIGTNGTSIEYGDSFDTMGAASAGANHFNTRYKAYLNWLQAGETLSVSTSGVYRIYPHDDTNSTGLRGLRIVRTSTTNYWVEFRQKFTGNRWLMSGAGIRWAGNGNERSHLLDTTPGSTDGKNDAALVLGRTFSDPAAGIHITTLWKGGTTPESLDIAVNLGTFPGNAAPTVSVGAGAGGTTTTAGSLLDFTATASDANSDALAYYWDFGDGTFGTNGSAASKSWALAGEYVVRCVVSDMKGGVAGDSLVVTVGNPGTYRISGQALAGGAPVQGVRVWVSSTRMTYTDSDGGYTITGLPAGSYTVSAYLDGYNFTASGFANPVGVGPNATGVNFTSGAPGGGTVALTSPSNGASYTAPSSITLSASATPASGQTITKVEFYQANIKLGEDLSAPYSCGWVSPAFGSYTLTARMTDTSGIIVTSAPVAITVNPAAPGIVSQPQNQTVAAGSTATFSVTASGSAPLTYQWRFNGTNLPGANSASLSLFNVQPQQAGNYSVVVSNAAGTVTSGNAVLTITCSFSLSASSASFNSAAGSDNVSVTTQGGCSWSVANVPGWITITSGNGGSGNGTVGYAVSSNSTAFSRSALLVIAARNYTVYQGPADFSQPDVAISSPSANATLTNALVTLSGTADDDVSVARVDYRIGSAAFAAATGTTAWSVQATLVPGTNVISVRAVDSSGNVSVTNSRTVFCAVPATLNLTVKGNGKVKGATNGQHLNIGKPYKITATPVAGFVFSNWTGDVSSDSPTLTFMMQSNLSVVANFVTNPFTPVKGSFNGLFYESNQVQLGQSGFFTFNLTDRGTYTASLRIGNRKSSAKGRLGLEGQVTNTITRHGTNALTVAWAVALDGSDQIVGTVTDGSWTAALLGDRATFGKTNPPPQSGRYTWIVLGTPGTSLAPEGDSYGTAVVDSRGRANLTGSLADKTPLVAKAPLSKNGHWPLYAPLYGGKGALLGWAVFTNQASTDFDGLLSWIKPAIPTATFYPGGFASESALLGSRYTPPLGATNHVLAVTNAQVLLTGGNLSPSLTNDVVVGLSSKITNAGPHLLSLNFTLSSGSFSGKITPAGSTMATSFKGAVLQKANFGSGCFLGTNQSGLVTLDASP